MSASQRSIIRSNTLLKFVILVVAIIGVAVTGPRVLGAERDARLAQWLAQASAGLEPRAVEALRQIPDSARGLLALRGYLRAGTSLAERWSWSQQQIDAYPSSAEARAAAREIDAVNAAFVAANPGYSLSANREPRSLALQLSRWNSNASVARTAAALADFMARTFPASDAQPSDKAVGAALLAWSPPSAATLAVPGLSAHGQGRAYDFRVLQHDKVIADTVAASARSHWDDAGWTRRLHAAVAAAGDRFTGPLTSPYEPWHYAYSPRDSSQQ